MKDAKSLRRITGIIIVSGLLLSLTASIVLADNDTSAAPSAESRPGLHEKGGGRGPGFPDSGAPGLCSEKFLEKLVEQEIITQEQADKITAFLPEKMMMQGEPGSRGPGFGKFGWAGESFLKNLVEQGIITQEQADQWQVYNESKIAERKAELETIKNMSEEARKAYFEEKMEQKADPMAELVTAGIITQEQADQIAALRPEKGFVRRHAEKQN
ncbi:MAG: hypothetical protein RBT41_11915 [Clostridia bacterium]|jgi:hypothetical protein|nr:hypothetical protein [Clostridia bacterium]